MQMTMSVFTGCFTCFMRQDRNLLKYCIVLVFTAQNFGDGSVDLYSLISLPVLVCSFDHQKLVEVIG